MKALLKQLLAFFVLLLFINPIYAQDTHFSNARNGLNVRSGPSLNTDKIVKLPYGFNLTLLEIPKHSEEIKVDGKKITGKWTKVEFDYIYYSISEQKEYSRSVGYVFDPYISPYRESSAYNNRTGLGEEYFYILRSMSDTIAPAQKHTSIANFDSINGLINHCVKWYPIGDSIYFMERVLLENGKELGFNPNSTDYGYIQGESRYYPDFGILEMEGGHDSDMCLSVKTGEWHYTAGNPRYTIKSPNDKYRLTGYFGGQECISYFFQKRDGDQMNYFRCPEWMEHICLFEEFYWLNDTRFIYSTYNFRDSEDGVLEYYAGDISK